MTTRDYILHHYHDLIDATRPYDIMKDLESRVKETLSERTEAYQEKLKVKAKMLKEEAPRKDIRDRFDHKRIIKKLYRSWKKKCDFEMIVRSMPKAECEENPLSASRKAIRKYL
eukprot:TRINITY_DN7064_c0_g2_i2.p1 TRINITY_DN7064_c0_g2~~TRINITY_DN7064_c0_g2_i2.p1  ORF type:complete len:114 (+),score=30.85 TRINITY_DN7064_c0_g2_i2:124-465(+)